MDIESPIFQLIESRRFGSEDHITAENVNQLM